MQEFQFSQFRPSMLDEMYDVFQDSFSDYSVPFKLSKEQFVRKFVQKLKIKFKLSAGAYDHDYLVGFIFTAVNMYEGKLTAYNGGTGVRPGYRGNAVTQKIYDFLFPHFVEQGIEQCILEVLVENEKAIAVYESIGFEKSKYYHCFKLDPKKFKLQSSNEQVHIQEVEEPDWFLYEQYYDIKPSFLDSRQMVNQNLANECIIEAKKDRKCIGYAIFQPRLGRISHIGVHRDWRGKGVGKMLMIYIFERSLTKSITVVNILKESEDTIRFLKNLGFENQLDQYEMVMKIKA